MELWQLVTCLISIPIVWGIGLQISFVLSKKRENNRLKRELWKSTISSF